MHVFTICRETVSIFHLTSSSTDGTFSLFIMNIVPISRVMVRVGVSVSVKGDMQ